MLGVLAFIMYSECGGVCNIANTVLGSIDITDDFRFRDFMSWNREMFNKIWRNKAFGGATINECADLGMECSGVENNRGMNGALVWLEDSIFE